MHGWSGCKSSCRTFLTRRVGDSMLTKLLRLQCFLVAVMLFLFGILPVAGLGQSTNTILLDIAWSPDGTMLASIGDDGTFNVMVPSRNTTVFEFARPSTLVKASIAWSPLGDHVAAGIGNRMYIWDVDTWQLLYEYGVGLPSGFFTWINVDNIPEGVQTITWSVDGRYVIVGTYSYETSVWDTELERLIFRNGDLSGGGPGRVWLSNDGWMGDGANKLNAFSSEYLVPSIEDNQRAFGGSVEGGKTEPRPDNTQIAWGTDSGFLLVIDLTTTWGIQGFDVTQSSIVGFRRGIADISWDGTWNFIAVVSRDGELYIANLVTEEVASLLNVDGQLNAVDWNPRTNQVTYAGVSSTGEPILETVDVSGIAGVPVITLTPTFSPTPSPTETPTTTYIPSFTPTSTVTLTSTPTDTLIPTPTATFTPTHTATPTFTSTFTVTFTPTATLTSTFTPTPSVICTATATNLAAFVSAINAANANGTSPDTICLTNSTYSFLTAQNSIAIPSITTPITIVGNGAVLERGSGAPQFRLFNVTGSGSLTLQNLTLRNGNAGGGNGGAVQNAGNLTLNGVIVTGNSARFAGGIHSSGALTITNSTFTSNTSQEDAGAIYLNSGTLTMTDSTVESNSARFGSGVYLNNGSAALTNVTFRSNTANEQGAGVYQRTGTLTITGGLFKSNIARFGNGVYVDAGTATLSGVVMWYSAVRWRRESAYLCASLCITRSMSTRISTSVAHPAHRSPCRCCIPSICSSAVRFQSFVTSASRLSYMSAW